MDGDHYIMVYKQDCTTQLVRAEDVSELLPPVKPKEIYTLIISAKKIVVAIDREGKIYHNMGDGWYCKGKKLPYIEKGLPWTKK